MAAQAFFYNAIFFTYALVLTRFYGVPAAAIGWYILPFALGNFLGPLVLGPLFDLDRPQADDRLHLCDLGRVARDRRLAVPREACSSADAADRVLDRHLLLRLGGGELRLSDGQRELSAGSARARDRPLLRARHGDSAALVSPWLFGVLVGTGERGAVFRGYLVGAGLMIAAALIEFAIGVKAERQSLESVARPLSARPD